LLQWYGNNGSCYSFQGIFPPDQKESTAINPDNGAYLYTGYRVNEVKDTNAVPPIMPVINHTAYGVSVYSNFFAESLTPENGISTATGSNILFVNSMTRFLEGSLGGISNVINGEGYNTDGINSDSFPAVCQRAPGPSFVCTSNGAPVRPSVQAGPRGACP
jgi:hypothetical protein